MTKSMSARGIGAFVWLWLGQLVSITGSNLTNFALGVWVYQNTGIVTHLAIISFCAVFPVVLTSPLAGALVDRWDRRWVMILSDTGAALGTLTIAVLFLADRLQIWHLYLIVAFIATTSTFQVPAAKSSVALLVPKAHLVRANGMIQLSQAIGRIAGPFLGGILLVAIGIEKVILIDFATFLFALAMLTIIRIPKPKMTEAGQAGKGSLFRESVYGITYLTARPGLLSLILLIGASNFLLGLVGVLVMPLVLSITSEVVLGSIMSVGGLGMLVGSLLIILWGGPRRRIEAMLMFMLIEAVILIVVGIWSSILLFFIAIFVFFFAYPIEGSCAQAILQTKVDPDMQGRVFAIFMMVAVTLLSIGNLISGPLADYVFEPLFLDNGPLAETVGQIIGIGPGRGIALMFVLSGIVYICITAIGYLYPRLRWVEHELPDAIVDEEAGESESYMADVSSPGSQTPSPSSSQVIG